MDVPSGQVLCTYHPPLIGHSSFKNKVKTLKLDLLKMYRTIKAQVRLLRPGRNEGGEGELTSWAA